MVICKLGTESVRLICNCLNSCSPNPYHSLVHKAPMCKVPAHFSKFHPYYPSFCSSLRSWDVRSFMSFTPQLKCNTASYESISLCVHLIYVYFLQRHNRSPMVKTFRLCLGHVAQLVGTSSLAPNKCCGFNPLLGSVWEAANQHFSLSLSLSKINEHILRWGLKQQQQKVHGLWSQIA